MSAARLTVEREARVRLAVFDAFDARDASQDEFRAHVERVVSLAERLRAEQLAESGYLPATLDGCIAVLAVAARILEAIGVRGAGS
jgi:hypothetical protein